MADIADICQAHPLGAVQDASQANRFAAFCGIQICNSRPSNMIGNVDLGHRRVLLQ